VVGKDQPGWLIQPIPEPCREQGPYLLGRAQGPAHSALEFFHGLVRPLVHAAAGPAEPAPESGPLGANQFRLLGAHGLALALAGHAGRGDLGSQRPGGTWRGGRHPQERWGQTLHDPALLLRQRQHGLLLQALVRLLRQLHQLCALKALRRGTLLLGANQ